MMKHVFLSILVLLTMVSMLCGCGKQKDQSQNRSVETVGFEEDLIKTKDDWVIFRSNEFSITFPPIFELDTSGYGKLQLVLRSPLTDDTDIFMDYIAVAVREKDHNRSLESFGKLCVDDILNYTENPEIIKNGLKHHNGKEFYEIIYSEQQPVFRLVHEQHIYFDGHRTFIVSLTCEDAVFEQCREVGEVIMSTFTIR